MGAFQAAAGHPIGQPLLFFFALVIIASRETRPVVVVLQRARLTVAFGDLDFDGQLRQGP
jgi:hypothetical protein